MMKKFLLLLVLFSLHCNYSQTPNFEWGEMIGNNQNLFVYDNATDASGNVYLTGEYSGTVDFDPGNGTQTQSATASGGRDIFILKLDATGAFGWVRTYGGTGIDFGQRIAVDNTGNVFVGGRFQNSVNFSGYGGFASNGGYDGFLLKIDAAGTLQWVIDLSGGGTEGFLGLTTDGSGNVFTTGFFNTATVTLGGLNSTSTTLTRTGASANYDFFVSKYSTNGEIIWSNSTGAGYDEIPYNIALTDDNKVVTVGTFIGASVDFNPGAASNLLYSNSNSTTTGFIQVLNASNGAFSWARSLGSTSNDAVYGVATANNNIYVTGYFTGSQADFNTTGSGGGDVINRIGAIDSFVAKYTSNATFVWVKQIRGTTGSDVRGTSIAVKGTPEKVYASGTFTSQVYLNPASSTTFVSAFGGRDAFVVSLDDAGLYQWGGSIRSMDNEDAWGLSIDNDYNVYISGYSASGNIALNPFASNTVPNNSTTGNDFFVVKLAQPNACLVNIPDVNFKNYLLNNTAINTNADTEIQCSEANAFTGAINCSNLNISDLTGIEAFTNLTSLLCYTNPLGTLDVSQNTALTTLDCNSNQLTSIDLSSNIALTNLRIMFNSLTSIDVTQNIALVQLEVGWNSLSTLNISNNLSLLYLSCNNNNIQDLDVSLNTNLNNIACFNNQLISLNIANGNNSNFTFMNAPNNPNLGCIQIDNGFTPPSNGTWIKDASASYSFNCAALSVNSFETKNLNIYPNPVKDILFIENSLNKNIDKISVLDVTGKVVLEEVNNVKSITLSTLKQGFYWVLIASEGGITSYKVIKE